MARAFVSERAEGGREGVRRYLGDALEVLGVYKVGRQVSAVPPGT